MRSIAVAVERETQGKRKISLLTQPNSSSHYKPLGCPIMQRALVSCLCMTLSSSMTHTISRCTKSIVVSCQVYIASMPSFCLLHTVLNMKASCTLVMCRHLNDWACTKHTSRFDIKWYIFNMQPEQYYYYQQHSVGCHGKIFSMPVDWYAESMLSYIDNVHV